MIYSLQRKLVISSVNKVGLCINKIKQLLLVSLVRKLILSEVMIGSFTLERSCVEK